MGAFDFLFGDVDDSAQKGTIESNARRQQFIADQADAARQDIMSIFPAAQTALAQGIEAALGAIRASTPQQLAAVQEGNRNAQRTALMGLAGQNAALMGDPLDFSMEHLAKGISNPLPVDLSFLQFGVPDFFLSNEVGARNTSGAIPEASRVPGTPATAQSDISRTFNNTVNTDNRGVFDRFVNEFQSGQIGEKDGTLKVIDLGNRLGMTAADMAAKLGIGEADVRRLAKKHGANILRG